MVCLNCNRRMKPVMIGVLVTEWTDDPNNGGLPVSIHEADIYECPNCKKKVVSNFKNFVYNDGYNKNIFNHYLEKSIIDYF